MNIVVGGEGENAFASSLSLRFMGPSLRRGDSRLVQGSPEIISCWRSGRDILQSGHDRSPLLPPRRRRRRRLAAGCAGHPAGARAAPAPTSAALQAMLGPGGRLGVAALDTGTGRWLRPRREQPLRHGLDLQARARRRDPRRGRARRGCRSTQEIAFSRGRSRPLCAGRSKPISSAAGFRSSGSAPRSSRSATMPPPICCSPDRRPGRADPLLPRRAATRSPGSTAPSPSSTPTSPATRATRPARRDGRPDAQPCCSATSLGPASRARLIGWMQGATTGPPAPARRAAGRLAGRRQDRQRRERRRQRLAIALPPGRGADPDRLLPERRHRRHARRAIAVHACGRARRGGSLPLMAFDNLCQIR